MLDINLFRQDKGGNPELVKESQRRRFANEAIVDQIIDLDQEWRQCTVFFVFFWMPEKTQFLPFFTFSIVFHAKMTHFFSHIYIF